MGHYGCCGALQKANSWLFWQWSNQTKPFKYFIIYVPVQTPPALKNLRQFGCTGNSLSLLIFCMAFKIIISPLTRLGVYVGTVLGGLAIHFFIVLPLVFFFGTKSFKTRQQIRKFPITYFRYIQGIGQAMLTALSTASR